MSHPEFPAPVHPPSRPLFLTTGVVGGGTRFFPDGVRLDLDLVEQRAFDRGLSYAHYRTR